MWAISGLRLKCSIFLKNYFHLSKCSALRILSSNRPFRMDAIPHGVTVLPAFRPARWGDAHAFPGSGCAGAGLSAAGVPGRARLLVTEHVAPVSRCCLGLSSSSLCVCARVPHSVVSDSLRPRRLWPARLCPCYFPNRDPGVGCPSLLQRIFRT